MSRPAVGLLCAGLFVLLPMGLAGCGGEEEKKEETAVAPPPPPPPPRPRCALDDLRNELQISGKVKLSEAEAPPNCDDRRNLLVFFDAFVTGQADTLREMMSMEDSMQLEAMSRALGSAAATAAAAVKHWPTEQNRIATTHLMEMPNIAWTKVERGFYYMSREQYDLCNDQV